MTIRMTGPLEKQAHDYIATNLMNRPADQQFQKDSQMWLGHINTPNNAGAGELARRVFITLYHGGLQYRPSKKVTAWQWFGTQPWPAAAALSHGGRVLIQLPKANGGNLGYQGAIDHDDTFWRWLTAQGGAGGALLDWRIATHGISTLPHPVFLSGLVPKYLKEVKGKGQALAPRNVELRWFGMGGVVAAHHRHWGIDLALGGQGSARMTGIGNVDGNGSDGHMYLYYMAPKTNRYGGILIGVEGSRAGEYDQFGHKHTWTASSSDVSPTGGLKWRLLGRGPVDAEDDLFIDLTRPGRWVGTTVMNDVITSPYQPECVILPPRTYVGPNPADVSFIPNLEIFKKWSSVTGAIRSRSPITAVDGALQAYLQGSPYPNPPARNNALNGLAHAANTYVRDHPDDPRTKGVRRLLQCISAERRR